MRASVLLSSRATAARWSNTALRWGTDRPTRVAGRHVAATAGGAGSSLHRTAAEGPQPETLFRPDAAQLQGGGSDLEEQGQPQELPFPNIPHPDYEAERPQEQTAPEPDNPLPDLPPNHPKESPKGPEPEVPVPRRSEPDLPQFPPDIVPVPGPPEAPSIEPPSEFPGAPPPEFLPGVPSEMPDRGGSEIKFP